MVAVKQFFLTRVLVLVLISTAVWRCSEKDDPSINATEQNTIREFITANNILTESTSSGLHYTKIDSNEFGKPVTSQVILSVYYKISVLGETTPLDDFSDTLGLPSYMKIGVNAILPVALEEGLLLMREKEKFRFLIPSNLAFAAYDITSLASETVFDMEIYIDSVLSPADMNALELSNINRYNENEGIGALPLGTTGTEQFIMYSAVSEASSGQALDDHEELCIVGGAMSTENFPIELVNGTIKLPGGTTALLIRDTVSIMTDTICVVGDTLSLTKSVVNVAGDSVSLSCQLTDISSSSSLSFDDLTLAIGDRSTFEGLNLVAERLPEGQSAKVVMTSQAAYRESVFVTPSVVLNDLSDLNVIPAYAIEIRPFTSLFMMCTVNP